ncbi:MAG: phosphoribosyltransferase family protein [Atribacterota bacterium]|nr:phosphoribosyltransferase family protein [Atribacterota bacterium]
MKSYKTWEEIVKLVDKICSEIKMDYTNPDVIIPILRGGMVPARLISEYFPNSQIKCIRAKAYDKDEKQQDFKEESVYVENFDYDISHCVALVVDDISDTGDTLNAVCYEIYKHCFLHPHQIVVATIYYKERTLYAPDFYGEKVENDQWIVFPWELGQLPKAKALGFNLGLDDCGKPTRNIESQTGD